MIGHQFLLFNFDFLFYDGHGLQINGELVQR